LPPEISTDLARRAIDVASDGNHDPAWTGEDVISVLDALHGTLLAVLGGDVFVRQPWGFAPTTESWSCERAVTESTADYAVRSRDWARDYVVGYTAEHDGDFVFVLYFDEQQDAA
jgi:hypothetical protein